MRKYLLLVSLAVIAIFTASSQDFSNKGKEFWVTSGYHYSMASGTPPVMTLSITSDVNTTYKVEAYGAGTIATGNIIANQVTNVTIPSAYFTTGNGLYNNRAIHVTAPQPVVVYSFITQSLASAATLCLPANVLGKQYYSANYTQNSNTGSSNGFITIIAVEDNTTVEIIPTALTLGGWAANSVNTITLNKGQTYQVLGALISPNVGYDLTGTSVRSIASGTGGCKRIAVFSGSGRVLIGAGCTNGADNLYQQLYPAASWGRKYLTVPSANKPTNYYRIMRTSPTANVKLNGAAIPAGSFTNNFYEFSNTIPNMIEADTSICVVQYFTSADCIAGNANPYDPDMVILNPVEQNISNVTLISSDRLTHTPITPQHHIHVILKNSGTAISSFRFDGAPIPATSAWVTHPADPTYSYLYLTNVSETYHSLKSDSGFNALAYGYASNETYAYSAGTNVKDLYTQPGTSTPNALVSGSVCTGTGFKFKISLPYQPDSIYWDLTGVTNTPPYGIEKLLPTLPATTLVPDSITIVGGKQLYWYSLPGYYTLTTPGTYDVPITAFAANADGCGNQSDYDQTLVVSNPPTASFTIAPGGCVAEPYQFTETTVQTPLPTYIYSWNFGDPGSGANNTATTKNASHTFSAPGTYTITFSDITTGGCVSSTATQTITVAALPTATISSTATAVCQGAASPIVTFTGTLGTPGYTFSYNLNGVPQTPLVSAGTTATITVPTGTVGPLLYELTSIKNTGSTLCTQAITGQQVTINVNANHAITLTTGTASQAVCINTAIVPITYTFSGGATGVTVTGLPAGVNYTVTGSTVTLNGAPNTTTGSPFSYTITTTGNSCTPATATGTITVNPDHTITLTTANNTQTVCINKPITTISYTLGGGATGATITGLPTGVTYSVSGSTLTIIGSPTTTAASPYNYTVTTTGNGCLTASATGTITVNPDHVITLTAGNPVQTVCVNNPITAISYLVPATSGGTGVTITGLPAGVTSATSTSAAGVAVVISGTPNTAVGSPFTYTITTTGNGCQTATATGTITVNPDHTIALNTGNNTQTVCINTAINLISYTLGGGATGVTITGLPAGVTYAVTGTTLNITGSPNTTAGSPFNYTITTTGNACVQATATGTITVNPVHTLTLTTANNTQTVCINTAIAPISYTIGGGGTGATVTGLPPGVNYTVTGTTLTITGTPNSTTASPYNYSIITTGNSCLVATASGTITVTPDAAITLNSAAATTAQELCNNSAITQIAYTVSGSVTGVTVTGLPTGVTYTYNAAAGTITIDGTPNAAANTYNYTINVTGACVPAVATGSIKVNALPTPSFTVSAPDCESKTITFTDASTPNTGTITTWAWDFGDPASGAANTSAVQNPTHTYATASGTPYIVSLTVTTDKGCTTTAPYTKPVTVSLNPKAGFMVPQVCLNDPAAVFTDTSKIASGTIVGWQWDYGDPASGAANTSTAQTGSHHYTVAGSYTVTLTVFSNTGCSDVTTNTIFVNGLATSAFNITNTGTQCSNDSVSIVNKSIATPGSIIKLEIYWDDPSAAPADYTVDNSPAFDKEYKHKYPSFQSPASKTFTIKVVAYSGTTCSNTSTKTITVYASPKAVLQPFPDTCFLAAPFVLTQGSSLGGLPLGTGVYTGPGITGTNTFNPALAGIGTHSILYTYTATGSGCIDTARGNITVLDTASAKFSFIAPLCENSNGTFTDLSTAPAGVVLASTVWNFGDGSPLENHAPGSTFTHVFPSGAATYTVSMYNRSVYGCTSTITQQQVTVSPLPKPAFTVDKTFYCLPYAAVVFDPSLSVIADGTENAFTYLWDFGDPSSGVNNTSVAKTPTHVYTTDGPFSVTLTITSGVGCTKSTVQPLNTIHKQPKAAFTTNKPSVCIQDDVVFTDATNPIDGTTTAWNWDFGDGTTATTPSYDKLFISADTFTVKLYITNSIGCNSDTIEKPFAVYNFPEVNAGDDRYVLEGGSIKLDPTVTGQNLQFLWSPSKYLNNPMLERPTASMITEDITYRLTATGIGGCPRFDDVFIKVLKFPTIPNTFTPNNDGINDRWRIKYLESYPNCRIQVFTKAGQVVYEIQGYSDAKAWDGTVKGKPLPLDTYYYIIEPGNGRDPITGYVTILK